MADVVTVKSKFGQLGTVDKSDLPNALSHGFSVASNEEIKDHNDEQEYGTGILNPLTAMAESAADTATFGASRQLENATGITTPEAQAARAKFNPMARVIGIPVGLFADPIGAIGLTGKLGAKATGAAAKAIGHAPEGASYLSRAMRNIPAAAAGAAAEGAAFGAGASVSEDALGDPDAIGEHLLSNVGYGALFGGGLGAMLEGGANVFGKSSIKTPIGAAASKEGTQIASFQNDINQGVVQKEAAEAQDMGLGLNPNSELAQPLSAPGLNSMEPFKSSPTSLSEIGDIVKTNFPLVSGDLPSGQRLKEVVADLPDLQFKPHNLQHESLTDQGARDAYKTFLETQGDDAKALRDYESLQKSEAKTKLDNTISGITPGTVPISDPVSAGENAVSAFSKQYESEKKELAPLFKQFDQAAEGKNLNWHGVIDKLQQAFPTIGEYLTADANGVFKLSKYKSSMPFSKNAYGAIKDLVGSIEEGNLSLSGLRNVRDAMGDRITLNAAKRDMGQIGSLRRVLMDEMQEQVGKLAGDTEVREAFKRYAVNEQQREVMEKIMGGSISDKASFAKTIKPEDVLNKIFSNTVSVSAAKDILGPEFNKVLSDYLATTKAAVTDQAKNGFSSNKFSTFLKDKNPELAEALKDTPQVLKRMNSLSDYMRILPDAPSSNPSGTAKTLNILEKMAALSRSVRPTQAIQDLAERAAVKGTAAQQRYTIDEVLSGKNLGAAKAAADENLMANSMLARVSRQAENAAHLLQENAKAIFATGYSAAKKSLGLIGSKLAPAKEAKLKDKAADQSKFKDVFAKINEIGLDPDKMITHLENATASLYPHAPNISQGVHAAAVRATQFLAEKIPVMPPRGPLSQKSYDPSPTEIAQFERYYNVIEDPMLALHQVKMGTILPETTEALSVVFPKMYDQMKLAVLNEATNVLNKRGHIPFHIKQSISMFLGEAMDSSLSPESIQANQLAFAQAPQPVGGSKKTGDKLTVAQRTGINHGDMDS